MTEEKQQPTTEQCLHSIALSLIEINKELKESRREQVKLHRTVKTRPFHMMVTDADSFRRQQRGRNPTLWQRISRVFVN